eukprot:CAMPEP_0172446782 /NCGR_PEP_ID=MMETSP1065-20121228/6290_1 /TAXON_ID=265537 /ORGANISM="Amphiprora paludosa, Strain CCMP125" /LENGTH=1196 /DNA_ID=CAMNT_0013197971 /DNA_START=183 /DNA_END=3773 /DNA_ORIENTATION=+
MMVLHPPNSTDQVPGRAAMQKPAFRRRRSKGTIAGFAFGVSDGGSGSPADTLNGGDLPETGPGTTANPAAPGSPNQPQHNAEANTIPTKPCHTARLALMCAQNAIRLGARTQLYMCPPGRARRELQSHLRQKAREKVSAPPGKLGMAAESGGYYGLEKMIGSNSLEEYENHEEDFLISTNTFDVDSEEEASSGDEDDIGDFDDLFSEDPMPLLENMYSNLREPLYTPVGGESSLSNPNGAPMTSGGTSVPGKLPFNRRKMRLFDLVTADEKKTAREYLQVELRRSKTRSSLMLSRHLRRVQREEIRKKRHAHGEPVDDLIDSDGESPEEKLLQAGVSQISAPMNPALSAALLLESLSVGRVESLEGMGKCYDGIVNAGVALLDAQSVDPTKPPSADDKARATRSEVMAALAPLLVTSLEQPSGELILLLAKLRRMCGTKRYQRRFVQRIAPSLIRPPRGAMWCLRHQNDMEAILAACELILDSAFEIFSKGWYERGRLMLADSKRAETLDTAAKQLRNLSSEPGDSLARGLSSGPRRRLIGAAKMKQDKGGNSEPLAEWEVIAVDREIRLAISHVLTNDWSRTNIQHESSKIARRVGAISKRTNSVLPTTSSDMSPKAIPSSPGRGGGSVLPTRTPQSPPHMPSAPPTVPPQPTPETMENVFGPAFANQAVSNAERSQSPPPTAVPGSPPVPQRSSRDYLEGKPPQDGASGSENPSLSIPTHTPPPLSPRSPARDSDFTPENIVRSSNSPKQGKSRPPDPSSGVSIDVMRPASPSSVGTSASVEMSSFKISGTPSSGLASASSSSPGAPPTSQYRTLTSTAAERKRTVAACRALRAQIQRFEDAFVQLHGRPPKGAAERAPLATTYAQYREWKRAIRADAACRIQALLRGARTRLILLRSGDSDVTHVVLRRAGRPGSSPDLAIPVDIGISESDHGIGIGASSSIDSGISRPSNSSVSASWSSRPQIRSRLSNGEDRAADFANAQLSSSNSGGSARPSPPTLYAEFAGMTLNELQARKRDLKKQLKQYDMNFFRRHGRMPVKAEKEPIRHLYESYNNLKVQITHMERSGTAVAPPSTSPAPQRTVSPPSGSESNDESPARDNIAVARSTRRMPRAESPPVAASSSTSSFSQDLAALKAEKQQLHQMLRSYEKDFYKEHQVQVSSFDDIKPVASQYRRYKEIKKAIANLQKNRTDQG